MKIKFIQDLIDKVRNKVVLDSLPILKREWTPPNHTYKNLICVTGFTYSGSGALIDLLSEYDNVTSISYADKESGRRIENENKLEVDFFREIGGVLDLEKSFEYHTAYRNSYYISLFLHNAEYFYKKGGIYNDEYMRLTKEFLDNIINYQYSRRRNIGPMRHFYKKTLKARKYQNLVAPFVLNEDKRVISYTQKNLTIEQYHEIAKEYIKSVLKTIQSEDNLVLDQFLSMGKTDIDLFRKYIDNFKWIAVYRDPRDRFAWRTDSNTASMKEVNQFIELYKYQVEPYKNLNDKDYKFICFNDLILNYNKVKNEIEQFLGLNPKLHTKKISIFKP